MIQFKSASISLLLLSAAVPLTTYAQAPPTCNNISGTYETNGLTYNVRGFNTCLYTGNMYIPSQSEAAFTLNGHKYIDVAFYLTLKGQGGNDNCPFMTQKEITTIYPVRCIEEPGGVALYGTELKTPTGTVPPNSMPQLYLWLHQQHPNTHTGPIMGEMDGSQMMTLPDNFKKWSPHPNGHIVTYSAGIEGRVIKVKDDPPAQDENRSKLPYGFIRQK